MMPIGLSFLAYMMLGMFAMKLVSMSARQRLPHLIGSSPSSLSKH